VVTVLPHEQPRRLAFGPVCTSKPGLCKPRYLTPIKYLSSECIITWTVCRLCSSGRSFASRCQICDPTNVRWVTIETPLISRKLSLYCTATQWISVGSQIWKWEVTEILVLRNLRTAYVMIRSELKYLIGAKVAGTVIWDRGLGTTRPKNRGFMSSPGNSPAKTKWFGFLAGFGTEPNWTAG